MSDEWTVGGEDAVKPAPAGEPSLIKIFNEGLVKARGFLLENKPRRCCEALSELREEIAVAAEARDGLLAPDQSDLPSRQAAPPPQLGQGEPRGATIGCMQNAHQWGPKNAHGHAECINCGTVSLFPNLAPGT